MRKTIDQLGADRLAYEVAVLIEKKILDPRSRVGDALLDYLRIGCGGPPSVPEWMEEYRKS